MSIIKSLLDNDLYKFTMQQAVLHQYPATMVKYRFKCRKGTGMPAPIANTFKPQDYLNHINKELDSLCKLRFSEEELDYLGSIRFIKPDYVEYLRNFKLNRNHIKATLDKDDHLAIAIEGPWVSTILFEVPVLAIVSEVYHEYSNHYTAMNEGEDRLKGMVAAVRDFGEGFRFADFGTRRRFSWMWQDKVVKAFVKGLPDSKSLIGTSNVMLAKKYGIIPIGTMAHEWIMAHQQLGPRLVDSQKAALDAWVREYRGDLGIALSDTVGFDAFLRDFDLFFAKLYDGCRHDSGDPYEWCEKLIAHYQRLGVDPTTKTAVFSDGLTVDTAHALYEKFNGRIRVSFGIGTSLTNSLSKSAPPIQIVIKLTECNGRPVAKVSDSKGKGMCEDKSFETYLKSVFQIEEA